MRCWNCGSEAQATTRFCGHCGAEQKVICAGCGTENPGSFKFCGQCAMPLKEAEGEAPGERAATPSSDAERRPLTVMFCDLVGSTDMSSQLDPEDLHEVISAYHDASSQVIERYEGRIAQYLGDGLLVYFGYPKAYEDNAQRAVRTGLEILDAIAAVDGRLADKMGFNIQVRLGIHTGLVVVGELGGGKKVEQLALGLTPNLAARLQGLAQPNSIVISEATHRLVKGFFTLKSLGEHSLKGVSQPMAVYQVLGERDTGSRFEAARSGIFTPLVGRRRELELLLERWDRVSHGASQVVKIRGEAGFGKSRLVTAVKEHLAHRPHRLVICGCSPYHQESAFHPLIDALEREMQIQRQDSAESKIEKLEALLEEYGIDLAEEMPLFADLLSLPLPERYAPPGYSLFQLRVKTIQAMLGWLSAAAAEQPLLVVFEDLHWADHSTLELLEILLDQPDDAPILTLLTFRPEFDPPWKEKETSRPIVLIELERLSREEARSMMKRLASGKALPPEVSEHVLNKTDGNPLFIEELMKTLSESGIVAERGQYYELTRTMPLQTIPTTLHDSLMARLDRFEGGTEVIQLAAILGTTFSFELLKRVVEIEEAALRHVLDRLVRAELFHRQGPAGYASYSFKHALMLDAAYESILRKKRLAYHLRVARVLEASFPEVTESAPDIVARHYTEAQLYEQAIPYLQRAGDRAIERSANVEASRHLSKGLKLLKELPDSPQRAQQELMLQISAGTAWMAIKGMSAIEAKNAFSRALEICREAPESPQLFPVLRGLWEFYEVSGQLETAHETAKRLLKLASAKNDPALLVVAHDCLADTLFFMGSFEESRRHGEKTMEYYDPREHRDLAFQLSCGYDPATAAMCYEAWSLCLSGRPDRAKERIREAVRLAEDLEQPSTLGIALVMSAFIGQFLHEEQPALQELERAIDLANEFGYPQYFAIASILKGWFLARRSPGEGISELEQGLDIWRSSGAGLFQPFFLALQAEALGRCGRGDKGLALLDEALELLSKSGELFYKAEIHRLRGDLLESQPDRGTSASEECYLQAATVARELGARCLELRATIALARSRENQGNSDDARRQLAELLSWFDEGLDTPDLRAGRKLLDELGEPRRAPAG